MAWGGGGATWQVGGAHLSDWACRRKLRALVSSWANLLKSSPSNSGTTGSLERANAGAVGAIT